MWKLHWLIEWTRPNHYYCWIILIWLADSSVPWIRRLASEMKWHSMWRQSLRQVALKTENCWMITLQLQRLARWHRNESFRCPLPCLLLPRPVPIQVSTGWQWNLRIWGLYFSVHTHCSCEMWLNSLGMQNQAIYASQTLWIIQINYVGWCG